MARGTTGIQSTRPSISFPLQKQKIKQMILSTSKRTKAYGCLKTNFPEIAIGVNSSIFTDHNFQGIYILGLEGLL